MGNTSNTPEVVDGEWRVVPQIIDGEPDPSPLRSTLVAAGIGVGVSLIFVLFKAIFEINVTDIGLRLLPLGPLFVGCLCVFAYTRLSKVRSLSRGFLELFTLAIVLYVVDRLIAFSADGDLARRVWFRGGSSPIPRALIETLKVVATTFPSVVCYGLPALRRQKDKAPTQATVTETRRA